MYAQINAFHGLSTTPLYTTHPRHLVLDDDDDIVDWLTICTQIIIVMYVAVCMTPPTMVMS